MKRLAWLSARHTTTFFWAAAAAIAKLFTDRATELREQVDTEAVGADLQLAWADLLDAIADTLTGSRA